METSTRTRTIAKNLRKSPRENSKIDRQDRDTSEQLRVHTKTYKRVVSNGGIYNYNRCISKKVKQNVDKLSTIKIEKEN